MNTNEKPVADLIYPSLNHEFIPPAPDEPAQACEAFLTYIQLGPDRTLAEVALRHNLSLSHVKRWASLYHWRKRVCQYVQKNLQQRMDALAAVQTETAVNWARRAEEVREQEWILARKLLDTAHACIVNIQGRDPNKMSFVEIARALDIATKICRRATGIDPESSERALAAERAADEQFNHALAKTYGGTPDPDYPE